MCQVRKYPDSDDQMIRHTKKKVTLQGQLIPNLPGTGEKAVNDVENAQAPQASVRVANPALSVPHFTREPITIAIWIMRRCHAQFYL